MPSVSSSGWTEFLAAHPDHHLLQRPEWAELKQAFGWRAAWFIAPGQASGVQVLARRLPGGFSWAYAPKGPVGGRQQDWQLLWPDIDAWCRRQGVIFLKVEPDAWEDEPGTGAVPTGFRLSPHAVQPRRTLVVDLSGDEEAVLGRMKQKTRYNIRLAARKGVRVQASQDLEAFYALMTQTGRRDAFGVHSLDYYHQVYQLFQPGGQCALFLAESEGQTLAGLMAFATGARAWYFYGASSDAGRELMPTYLIQWEAMRWARQRGCLAYDLWGVPDADEASLEAQFASRQDGLWGVYRFKRGFGGRLLRAAGPWDRVYWLPLYWFYRAWLSRRGLAG